ncbi:hypothetical protein A6D6_02692 [Alcanivorax xiamenensis]|uniref:Phage head-tail adaptor, putative, SPP1 family n=1 Tax=Alcanivorax xiamenensis TaxID=1177156 RepID=A0ABQ6Y6E8_9GAMM|nr:head-tail adaptor protein [Alcanivorax xiamenensis]KAF0804928.1 hypothetical protein A6D6_02692 [Alcanivorax xiamenensis]
MLAYRLIHVITLQRPVRTRDPVTGGSVLGWETVTFNDRDRVPAEVLTGPGRELVAAQAQQIETTARINLRWFPVGHRELCTWRALWDGRVFNIESAETDATARREWRLTCSDGLTAGE